MALKIITVSQLNFYIKSLFDNDLNLQTVLVEGEISNLKDHYASGHMYFSLKDQKCVVSAVMFSFYRKNLRFRPETGMKVIVRARVTVYEPSGVYQLYVEDMQPDGAGALAVELEQLKKKLEAEGLFSSGKKKPIPKFPQTVGIITSPTGAAVRDIINIISRRYPCAELVLAPVLVQGESAPESLVKAVRTFSRYRCADVLIIGRGGGSMEDLRAFNSEALARAIFDCEIPVISAVGHETDFTICDFVADLRAPTPSAAAELCVPDREQLLQNLYGIRQYADSLIDSKIRALDETLVKQSRLCAACSPLYTLEAHCEKIESLSSRASAAAGNMLDRAYRDLSQIVSKADAVNPVAVLQRGFSYVTKDEKNISSAKELSSGDEVKITLHDGDVFATVQ